MTFTSWRGTVGVIKPTMRPGSLEEIGTKGGTMPPPADPDAKAYVPDSPLVLQSTRLIPGMRQGHSDGLARVFRLV